MKGVIGMVCSVAQASAVGSCTLCLAGDQCFDCVVPRLTHKACGHSEIFDGIIQYLNVC